MEVFISWSGARSRHIAESFKSWLGLVIQSVEPWISPDIDKGARWNDALTDRLEKSSFGIICLTKDNLNAPYILFEAGALSKKRSDRVGTFLYDLENSDIIQPLAQFQHTKNEKTDIFKLLESINKAVQESGDKALSDTILKKSFDQSWSQLEGDLNQTPGLASTKPFPSRTTTDLLQEILEIVRVQHSALEDIRKSLGSVLYKDSVQAAIKSRLYEEVSKEDSVIALMERFKSLAEQAEKIQNRKIALTGIESKGAVGTPVVKKADK
jgi:ATP-dependent Lon protease